MVNFTIVPQYDEEAFSADVIARWGKLQPWLKQDENLLYVQIGHLAGLCRDTPEVAEEIFQFLDQVVQRPDAMGEIANAVAISFVEWPEAKELAKTRQLSQRILDIIREQWERYATHSK